jgi:hypothetical protein
MALNITKGVAALFLVFIICFFSAAALSVANGIPSPPSMAVVFAWIGTAAVMFYDGTGFFRRFVASLLGSIVSLAIPLGLGFLNAVLLQNEMYEYLPGVLLGLGNYLLMAAIAQVTIAFVVARAVIRRGLPDPKRSRFAAV